MLAIVFNAARACFSSHSYTREGGTGWCCKLSLDSSQLDRLWPYENELQMSWWASLMSFTLYITFWYNSWNSFCFVYGASVATMLASLQMFSTTTFLRTFFWCRWWWRRPFNQPEKQEILRRTTRIMDARYNYNWKTRLYIFMFFCVLFSYDKWGALTRESST